MTTVSWEKLIKNSLMEMRTILYRGFDSQLYAKLMILRVGTYQEQNELKLQRNTNEFVRDVVEQLEKQIKNWDIRNYRSLADALPGAFPAWVIKGNCELEYSDAGWFFVKNL